jgi:hypothetical protein
MGNTYITKREAKAMENRIMSAMDSKFNEILEVLKTNQQSAEETTKKSTKKSTKTKKSEEKLTRAERLEKTYGTLEERTAYIEFKKSVMAELKALGEKNGKWIPKGKKYNEALEKAMEACKNQKLNKTEVKKVWTAYAK